MPEWDNGMIHTAFSQGMQTLKDKPGLGEWIVYLFVDDTAFVSRDMDTTNEMLARYHNFTTKWRVRVNPDKCKLLKNKYCDSMGEGIIGDHIITTVDFLKYLGYWIGAGGKNKNDEVILALATQLRFKVRALREVLGEFLTTIWLESYAAPSLLYGAELGNISNADLEAYQAWSLSEIMGIGRKGKSVGLWGGEVRRLCVFSDYNGPTWSQLRNRDAMITYRSINRMGNHTLPKKQLLKRGNNNILVKNILKQLGGGVTTAEKDERKLKSTLSLNTSKLSSRIRWKQKLKGSQKLEYVNWLTKLQATLATDTNKRLKQNLTNHVKNLGVSTAYFMGLKHTHASVKSISHIDSPMQADMKIKIRCIKSGQIAHTLVLEKMLDQKWGKQTFEQQLESILCPCQQGIQDIKHTVLDCDITKHLVDDWVHSIKETMSQIAVIKRITDQQPRIDSMTAEQCIAEMLHTPYEDKKDHKLTGLIKSYGTATNTYLTHIEQLQEIQLLDLITTQKDQHIEPTGFVIQPYESAIIGFTLYPYPTSKTGK
jgi:hypothetical protein